MANKIRKGDKVIVIAGNHKGKIGEIIEIRLEKGKPTHVKVSGVNLKMVLTKPNRESPKKERSPREGALSASNVALIDPKSNKATRVGFVLDAEGNKQRFAKKSNEIVLNNF